MRSRYAVGSVLGQSDFAAREQAEENRSVERAWPDWKAALLAAAVILVIIATFAGAYYLGQYLISHGM